MGTLENVYNNIVRLTVYTTSLRCIVLDQNKRPVGENEVEIRLQQQGKNMREPNTQWNGKMVIAIGNKNYIFNMSFLEKTFNKCNDQWFIVSCKDGNVAIDRNQFKEVCRYFLELSKRINARIN